ncbi:MAG: hypothetical protein ACRD2U_10495 [Terriglobales bacterium]
MMIIGCDLHTRYQQIAMGTPNPESWWSGVWSMRAARRGLFMRR